MHVLKKKKENKWQPPPNIFGLADFCINFKIQRQVWISSGFSFVLNLTYNIIKCLNEKRYVKQIKSFDINTKVR
jgi:hypothetical protein